MTDPRVFAAANPAAERRRAEHAAPGTGNRALWFALLAPPAAWSVDELVAISLHFDFCAALTDRIFEPWRGITVLLVGVGVLMLLVCVAGGVVGWRAHQQLGADTGMGDTEVDRRRFMARAAVVGAMLFSYGTMLRAITVAFVRPEHCGG